MIYRQFFCKLFRPCMGESWYLASDFQLFLIGPWILFILSRLKKPFTYVFLCILMAISCLIPGILFKKGKNYSVTLKEIIFQINRNNDWCE